MNVRVILPRGSEFVISREALQQWRTDDVGLPQSAWSILTSALSIDGKHPAFYKHDPQGTGLLIAHPAGTWMCQRIAPGDQFENYWCYYGGTVELMENPFAACVREVQEETGLGFLVTELEHVLTGRYIKPLSGVVFYAHLMAVKPVWEDAVPQHREPEKHGPPTLVPWDKIGELQIMPVMRDAWTLGLIADIRRKYYPHG